MSNPITLDVTDKKILLSLINNSRAPISVIAKETHLSREIVSYRLYKLEQENVITEYIAKINQPMFCSGVALMMCKLVRSNTTRFKEVIAFINKHSSINWCIETCGTSDLALTILYDTPKNLANIVTDLLNFLGSNLKEQNIYLYIDEYKFDRSGLITEKPLSYNKNKIITFDKQTPLKLDMLDANILSILSKNCRTKNSDIAINLHVTEDVVRLRIKSLERRGIILGYTVSIDAEKLGYEAYQMSAKLDQMNDTVINKIKYYMQTSPYIIYCTRTSGKYDLIIDVHAKNRQHFNDLLLDMRNNLPEIIDYEFHLNMRTYKEVFVPDERIKIRVNSN